MKKIAVILVLLSLLGIDAHAQREKILTKNGNEALAAGDIEEAREAYTKALEINPGFTEAQFNLGKTYQVESRKILEQLASVSDQEQQKKIYQQAQEASKKAATEFEKAAKVVDDPEKVNKVQYNMGNAHLMGGEVDKGIEAYKEALRNDPADEDARYNLAYAQFLKKKQEQQQQDQQQQDQQQQDQQQDEKQDQKNQDQQKDDQKKEDQQQQEQKKDELSKEDAEKMLEALAKQEKDLQDKLNKKKVKVQPIKIEKDW